MLSKNELRPAFKKIRAGLDKDIKEIYDKQICNNVINSPQFENSDLVMLYYPLGDEIDTTVIFEAAIQQNKDVCYPKCDKAEKTMRFYLVDGKGCFEKGAYGICEPSGCNAARLEDYKNVLCIVPCLSCDDYGIRLGYGAGYYDKYFANCKKPITKIALCYEACREIRLLSDEYDIAVDYIATQNSLTEAKNEQ